MPEDQSERLDPEIRRVVDAARGVWMRRLIDHSRANSLLFYRDLKMGTLDLSAEGEAVDRLLAGHMLTVESLASAGKHAESLDPVVRAQAEAEGGRGCETRSSLSSARHWVIGRRRALRHSTWRWGWLLGRPPTVGGHTRRRWCCYQPVSRLAVELARIFVSLLPASPN
jgi:hypothetical protein